MSVHSGEDGMEFYQIKFLLKGIIVEKCIVLCHGTIWCYVLDVLFGGPYFRSVLLDTCFHCILVLS